MVDVSRGPIFIVCHGRSGSTLLRYLLDTHESIVCPPELHLCDLIAQLRRINLILYQNKTEISSQSLLETKVSAATRETVDGLMRRVCTEAGKSIWCEKSVFTVDHLPDITRTYPGARYICLYRHCMDFVRSALETLSYAWGFGYESFLMKTGGDVADGLARFWCEKTRIMMSFEREKRYSCFSLRYESLVSNPEDIGRQIFEFLDLPSVESISQKIFHTEHQPGPGDPKIFWNTKIHRESVGSGREVRLSRLLPATQERMNLILKELGYEPVDGSWNAPASQAAGPTASVKV